MLRYSAVPHAQRAAVLRVGLPSAVLGLPGNFSELQTPNPYHRFSESETQGVGLGDLLPEVLRATCWLNLGNHYSSV